MKVKISNVNVLVEYPNVIFDLQFLYESLPRGLARYDPWTFPAVRYHWKYFMSIFRTGKTILHGLKTLDFDPIVKEATQELEQYVGKLPSPQCRITNLVATAYLEFKVDIEKLAETVPGAIYTPEYYSQGVVVPVGNRNVLVLPSGTIPILGLKSKHQLDQFINLLRKEVKRWPRLNSIE